jgi:hypothetical protein
VEVRCLWGSSILPPARIGKPILTAAPPRTPLAPLRSADDDVEATFRWTNGITSIDAGGRPWIIGRSHNPAPAKTWWWPHPAKVSKTWNFCGGIKTNAFSEVASCSLVDKCKGFSYSAYNKHAITYHCNPIYLQRTRNSQHVPFTWIIVRETRVKIYGKSLHYKQW